MRIPFRVAIVTLVLGLLLITTGAIIAIGAWRQHEALDYLKRAYLNEVAETVSREVGRLPDQAEALLREQINLAKAGFLPVDNPETAARMLAEQLRVLPDFAWLSFGSTDGQFFGATRLDSGDLALNFSSPAVQSGIPQEFRIDTDGRLIPHQRTPPLTRPYDPRTRPWFGVAVNHPDQFHWLPPYTFSEGVAGVTASLAFAPRKAVEGVFTSDFTLSGISQYLKRLKVGQEGQVLLLTRSGLAIADQGSPQGALYVRRLLELATASTSERMNLPNRLEATLRYEGEEHEILARRISNGAELEWIVAVALPRRDFMGFIDANRRTTYAIVFSALGLAALLGLLLSNAIAQPLSTITRDLDQIAGFRIEGASERRSYLKEVALLQSALDRMKASLLSFTRYAPEEIVREVVVSGREAVLSGEERVVTLLFCDLRGFTRFAEAMPPARLVAVLNHHFDAMTEIVSRNGGFVVDFLGDSLFAVFGAPKPMPDHALRAAACAIEMQIARRRLNRDNSARGWPLLEMGIGLNSGPGVVGNMGSQLRIKYGVAGHPVNLAARIESFTVGGQVLMSDSTRELLGTAAVLEGPFAAEGKGVGSTIQLWQLSALGPPHRLTLPPLIEELAALGSPIPLEFRIYHGKQLDPVLHRGDAVALSENGAEIATQRVPPPRFTSIQVRIIDPPLDGKVLDASDERMRVRFTGHDQATRDDLRALIQRAVAPRGPAD